jgi:hypothetical protein
MFVAATAMLTEVYGAKFRQQRLQLFDICEVGCLLGLHRVN